MYIKWFNVKILIILRCTVKEKSNKIIYISRVLLKNLISTHCIELIFIYLFYKLFIFSFFANTFATLKVMVLNICQSTNNENYCCITILSYTLSLSASFLSCSVVTLSDLKVILGFVLGEYPF